MSMSHNTVTACLRCAQGYSGVPGVAQVCLGVLRVLGVVMNIALRAKGTVGTGHTLVLSKELI